MTTKTDTNGIFNWDWFLGYRDTSLYKEIFAYKSGYKLWCFQKNKNHINQEGELTDELNITLDTK